MRHDDEFLEPPEPLSRGDMRSLLFPYFEGNESALERTLNNQDELRRYRS